MVLLITILIAIISVFLILIILLQNPKGGGLNSTFGGSQAANQIIGAANSTDLLEKTTWGLAGALIVLCLFSGMFFTNPTTGDAPINVNTNVTAPTNTPSPVPTPGATPPIQPGN